MGQNKLDATKFVNVDKTGLSTEEKKGRKFTTQIGKHQGNIAEYSYRVWVPMKGHNERDH
jgi:hypothetical protein